METISLTRITVDKNKVDYYFSVSENLQKYFKESNHLFYEYNYDVSKIPKSILIIPFIANVMPLVWITDSCLQVDELDRTFYRCLSRIRTEYQRMFPNVKFKGRLKVNKTVENTYRPLHQAGALFSGGLDALTTFIRVKEKQPILITEYGWHENEPDYSAVWEADKSNAMSFATSNELDNILIQSNYGNFVNAKMIDRDFSKQLGDTWWHGLHHGLAIISAAIPTAYLLRIECIYIASSNTPSYPVACASNPAVDNEIKFASGHVYHDGYELSRQDKVRVLVEHFSQISKRVDVRVCFKNEENCCKCEKCLRTIFGIIAEGHDPREYGFNINGDIEKFLKTAIDDEVKFFTDAFIDIYWENIQNRMRTNYRHILFKELVVWFVHYNFHLERRRSLTRYRITNFFPIVKRKLRTKYKIETY